MELTDKGQKAVRAIRNTVIFIFVGNYLGGRLILKHHIAIEP